MKMNRLKLKILSFIALLAVLTFAQIKKNQKDAFSLAEMFPPSALIYAQFQDLPALLKLWNESKLKRNYLESRNFREFSNRHLALKLAERFSEFNEALGFPLDSAAILSSSEKDAALAIYEIGRMEMVFVAPMSEEKILASVFFQSFSQFEETENPDGLKFYSREFAIDRGREKQTVLFANAGGFFVLATNKQMFFKTLENIKGKSKTESLAEESAFKDLTKKITPHLATFWVNQEKLNDDWYFKRYWLMNNLENLKKVRAGIFDFDMRDEGLFERRTLLLSQNENEKRQISPAEMSDLQTLLPNDVPFYKIESGFDPQTINDVLFDENLEKTGTETRGRNLYHYYSDDFEEDYFDLGSKFDEKIDEIEDEENSGAEIESRIKKRLFSDIETIFAHAEPKSTTHLIEPQNLSGQMFFECRKAVIFDLPNAPKINLDKFENAISALAQNRLMLGETEQQIGWQNFVVNNVTVRRLDFPMLRWNFFYAAKDSKLVVSNNAELIAKIFQNPAENKILTDKALDNLTVIRLDRREQAFDTLMRKLKFEEKHSNFSNLDFSDFFVDNVGSLLDLTKQIKRIEVRRNYQQNFLFEELRFAY